MGRPGAAAYLFGAARGTTAGGAGGAAGGSQGGGGGGCGVDELVAQQLSGLADIARHVIQRI